MKKFLSVLVFLFFSFFGKAQERPQVIVFYTAKSDQAHISFVQEALPWLEEKGRKYGFGVKSTSDWDELNSENLSKYQLVIFLDTRPEKETQRNAFERYMEDGGAWMGFHFSAFALTPSDFPQDWDWYHDHFLGSGQYVSNTWRPTSAILKLEQRDHPTAKGLSDTIKSSPSEWYRWQHDLLENPSVEILASIDPSSFPLGTGPKAHEIWHEGYYPVVWTNRNYRMIYFNMGHNDIDYEGGTNKTLSFTFGNEEQDQLILNAILWLLRN
ncbi:ThuA domain-containing protein [Algoriphagus sp. A40]|uniref:ThuA domain-containing protein n=1 Tax=Algoriphagus sp. A40 TaxID=1945863 RepID=UPI0011159644|nr:ThuA domain-containing protein [Algoriphagus sp. A40]